eukprot:GFUD01058614.1.p1 GENE.GFUD01058614.1~~GFUD01058614.1.p1  ORF type:complete len:202 (-),score=51.93 GFUD01058614.1:15-620(-)
MFSTLVLLSSLLISLSFIPAIPAWPSGAPASVCHTMLPGHGKEPQTLADSPYHVKVSSSFLKQDERIKVTLSSKTDKPFKGFIVKAVEVPSNNIIGTFTLQEDADDYSAAQYLACTHPQSSITHTSNVEKLGQTVEWSPPDQFTGSVVMVATFVQDGYTYWVNVTSDTVQTVPGEMERGAAGVVAQSATTVALVFILVSLL